MKLTPLKFRRAFAGVALIGAITVSGFVPAHATEVAVPETSSTVATETSPAPAVETLTAAITGTPEVGATLTADTNAADGATFQWLRDGVAIPAANASVYVPTEPVSFPASAV